MKAMESKLIYPELSYKVVGILYDVFNQIGPSHKEKYYQKALAIAFTENNLTFKEQVPAPLSFHKKIIGRYFFDFLIDDKIVIEIKSDNLFRKSHIE